MPTSNDVKIAALRAEVDSKRAAIKAKPSKFVPVTNCSLEFDGSRYNLHALDRQSLVLLGSKLHAIELAAKDLAFNSKDLVISGYELSDWIADIKSRLAVIEVKDEEAKLKVLDTRLQALLSEDAKTEAALDEIQLLLR